MGIPPVVRHMLLCEDVEPAVEAPHKLNIFGLVGTLRPAEGEVYPLKHPQLTVLLLLTGGRGTGQGQVVAIEADTEDVVWKSPLRTMKFGQDPLALTGALFRILDCVFPRPGLYWIQFWYDGQPLAEEALQAR